MKTSREPSCEQCAMCARLISRDLDCDRLTFSDERLLPSIASRRIIEPNFSCGRVGGCRASSSFFLDSFFLVTRFFFHRRPHFEAWKQELEGWITVTAAQPAQLIMIHQQIHFQRKRNSRFKCVGRLLRDESRRRTLEMGQAHKARRHLHGHECCVFGL